MVVRRAHLREEVGRFQNVLYEQAKSEGKRDWHYSFTQYSVNRKLLDRLDQYSGDTLDEMQASARAAADGARRRESIAFNTGMALTVGGFLGGLGSLAFPSLAGWAASLTAIGVGTALTHHGLHGRGAAPHNEAVVRLGEWKSFRPEASPVPSRWLTAGEISVSEVRTRAEKLQEVLDGGGEPPEAREIFGSVADAKRQNSALLRRLPASGSLAEARQGGRRAIAVDSAMAEGALDGLGDMLQGGVVVGALVGLLHPHVGFLQGLAWGGAVSALSLGVAKWQSVHQGRAAEGARYLEGLDRWQDALSREAADTTFRRERAAEEVAALVAGSGPAYAVIDKGEDEVWVGSFSMDRRE